jgi:hypothetical protein
MSTLREIIYKILNDDAKSSSSGALGDLLGYNATTKPQCVFLSAPPKVPDIPLLTYYVSLQTGRFPQTIYFNITAYGNNYEAVLNRVRALLDSATIAPTDYHNLMIKWDWGGPELLHEDYNCYYCQHRYILKAIPK